MTITVPKADLPAMKPGDPITLTGNIVGDNGDAFEIEVDAEAAAPAAPPGPQSFEEMDEQLRNEERAI